MSVGRVAAVVHTQAIHPHGGNEARSLPNAGDTLRLTFSEALGDDLLARTEDGLSLRLGGLGRLSRDLAPGDVLMLKVLSTAPRLELELFGNLGARGGAAAPPAANAEPAAMRLDQAALRQISWHVPDPATLAQGWRHLVLGVGMDEPLARAQLAGMQAMFAPAAGLADTAPNVAPAQVERWIFPVFAWGGVPAMLRVLPVEEEEGTPPRRRLRTYALRLELVLPGLGHVVIQVQGGGGGVQLSLGVERREGMPTVRDALPAIATAMASADLRLLKVALMHGQPPITVPALAGLSPGTAAAALAPGLFRAAAEVAVVLLGCAMAKDNRARA
ncbi:hypothetical protein GRF61_09045 [Azoarcus sp. TTM-91]|uniref:hypothetical protein n=1 Tax=Azoarcus sp. TTM-91 TaxID=2691581 RepID=UPI00145D7924|nr:hypothetical protein [Azoarcus sp. TTM-91]NMG34587.1 hypothetical protein [Azoarcus sp. TTM-91]